MTEFVWVCRRRDLWPECSPQGFTALDAHAFADLVERIETRGFFVERREAERCPAWKQAIPYIVVAHDDRVLELERLPKQGESRLHGMRSIGIGGHVNPVDASGEGTLILEAARRELAEELEVEVSPSLQPLGFVNDDGTAVGAVHVGLVFGVRVGQEPRIREREAMRGRCTPLVDLRNLCHTSTPIESWTREILANQDWVSRF